MKLVALNLQRKACLRCGHVHRYFTRGCVPIGVEEGSELAAVWAQAGDAQLVEAPRDLVTTTLRVRLDA